MLLASSFAYAAWAIQLRRQLSSTPHRATMVTSMPAHLDVTVNAGQSKSSVTISCLGWNNTDTRLQEWRPTSKRWQPENPKNWPSTSKTSICGSSQFPPDHAGFICQSDWVVKFLPSSLQVQIAIASCQVNHQCMLVNKQVRTGSLRPISCMLSMSA